MKLTCLIVMLKGECREEVLVSSCTDIVTYGNAVEDVQ